MTTDQPAHLTGKRVLIGLAAAFGIVFAVNGFFVYKALSTAPGEESGASYEAGLRYNALLAEARVQNALGWQHKISLDSGYLRLTVLDAAGRPVTGLALEGDIARPAAPGSVPLTFRETGDGVYQAQLGPGAGAWIASVTAKRPGQGTASESLYRAKERFWIPEVKS